MGGSIRKDDWWSVQTGDKGGAARPSLLLLKSTTRASIFMLRKKLLTSAFLHGTFSRRTVLWTNNYAASEFASEQSHGAS